MREPKIVGLLCNWCSYAGADLAGVSRFQYPPNLRVIRVMCTGRVDPYFVIHAFEKGADGVLVSGCHIGDCHYLKGNEFMVQRMENLAKALPMMGINPKRFMYTFVSAAEGKRFSEVVTQFVKQVKEAMIEDERTRAASAKA
ncbi:MAG: hydrogenase iron-sulfur subunit [Halobacteria archaeon]